MAPRSKSENDIPLTSHNLRAAILDLLALAWGYEHSAGTVEDQAADRLLENLIGMMHQYWVDFIRRTALLQISESLVERVTAAYARVTHDSSRDTLRADLARAFADEGIDISDEALGKLLVTRKEINQRVGDSTGGPKETARSRLGDALGNVSAKTVNRIASEHRDGGIPEALSPYAYGGRAGLPGIEKYILALLAEERAKQ
jgi:hypothetical protein